MLAEIPFFSGILVALGFLVLAILPWVVYFPFDALRAGLLGAEILLFILYVLPPFRLKERGLLGIATDALYAHALPAALAMLTYQSLVEVDHQLDDVFVALVAWQFFLGLRNILLHQMKDREHDLKSGIRTFAVAVGEAASAKWLAAFALLELAAWAFFLVRLSPFSPVFLLGWAVFLLFQAQKKRQGGMREWLYAHCDDFYVPWFPLLALGQLVWIDWHFAILLGLHWLLLKNGLSAQRDWILTKIWRQQ
jgi:4-hydroxybenzoate polyprenyltransferase